MDYSKIYIEEQLPIPKNAISETEAMWFILDADNPDCVNEFHRLRSIESACEKAVFAYTSKGLSEEDYVRYLIEGFSDIFEFPESKEWIEAICQKNKPFPDTLYPGANLFGLVSEPRIFIYDDSTTEITHVNDVLRGEFKTSGRTILKDFESQAQEVDADVYLVDLVTGEYNIGLETIEELSERVRGAVVAYSRITDTSIKLDCLKAGAQGYIEKDVSDNVLKAKLKHFAVLGRKLKGDL